ncbi:MAG: dipeptidyl aminopeptidase/acylaminoacyl peptidase [Brevundimonas sp.]|jgi:dipeptidyl aminopeptidase/acylaminoacyl peptidase|uniref:S9 family peptidase n=1 Tax=Brevundimonas sp. GW460-12-10-14-LB2 TaxID=1827469 RepID=UPI0007BCC31F|nr:S9 family peptidase [Brevundimonas sp. GW460-12-10-14-LB2]ANC53715.1 peptidase S9 [Brevundimonas sp. GW460-12-10-14-LB2]MEA3472872.1 S9 family peptidase [Pseudomonadota bacterium]
MRTTACLVSVLALMAALPAAAMAQAATTAATSPATPTYTAAQFFDTVSYGLGYGGAKAFSPDGKSVLIRSDKTGVFNAYALPIAGGDPVALTNSTTSAVNPVSYFPSDARILFTQDGGGDELSHLFVRTPDGAITDLTPGDKVKADFLSWSQDGKTFFVTSNARDASAFDVITYDATTYAHRTVFENTGGFSPAALSPDGRWLVLDKALTSANNDLYLVDLTTPGEPKLLTPHEGNVAYTAFDFTPDSKAVLIGTDQNGEFQQAIRRDLASGANTPLIQADWDVSFVFYSPSGRYRVSGLNADAKTELTLLDATTSQPVALTGLPDGDIGNVRFSEDEKTIAFTVSSDTSPADVFVADLTTGRATRLTHALNPAIDENALVEATIVRYPGEGGVMIPAVLYKPKGASAANPAPAIVLVHGGPGGQTRRGYSAMVQHLVNHGYAVLGANNRGSSGYGKTFFHLDDKKHGEADLRDIVAGGDWLRQQDWVADDQVAVMGGSYGGYITAAALAFHPDAFAAGVDIFGVTNWVRTLESIPPWWGAQRIALYDEMGDPATDAERHRRISPLFHTEGINKPLLVVQGENDPRVLKVESDELVAAVRANGVPVDYVVFPNEGHGFTRRDNRITAQDAYLTFLDKYVRK